MNKEKLISIVVPVYNVEAYIDECLESLVKQTYSNIEIIIVDDGATDCSGKKCDEWEKKDSRIKVIHKENGGLSDARNKGLEVVSGDYVAYADSDDFFDVGFCERMLSVAEETKADVVICGFKICNDDCSEIMSEISPAKEVVENAEFGGLYCKYNFANTPMAFVWNKLYKREIALHTMFKFGKTMEDTMYNSELLSEAKTIALIPDTLYNYRQRSGSLQHPQSTAKQKKKVEDWIYCVGFQLGIFKDRMEQKYFGSYVTKYLCRIESAKYYPKDGNRALVRAFYKKTYDLYKHDIQGIKYKIRLWLGRYLPWINRLMISAKKRGMN